MNFEESSKQFLEKLRGWFAAIAALAVALGAILGAFLAEETANRVALSAAVVVALVVAGVFGYRSWRASKLKVHESVEPLSEKAVLRGLLPFEAGDQLFGRDQVLAQLYTLATGSTFRFGVLWGDSGCGKTSLLRAGLVPKLQQDAFVPIYLPRSTGEPKEVIREVLLATFPAMAQRADEDLLKLLRDAADAERKKIVLILDQFEEFYLINRTPESCASFVTWVGSVVNDKTARVAFLLSIRTEFFSRLQQFAPHIEEPTSVHTTFHLHNLFSEGAKYVLKRAAEADGVEFAPELVAAVIDDLAVEEVVRPAELQIVGTWLKTRHVLRLDRYEAAGRARGILTSYISDEIERSADQYVARLVLRTFLAETGDTKRPTDLTLDEIMNEVVGPGQAGDGRSEIRVSQVRRILNQFVSARVLVITEDYRYNLVHDYLAGYVYTATRGVETNTERANRLLRRYLADYQVDHRIRMPFRTVRRVQRYASSELRALSRAQELLHKSRQRFLFRLGVGVVIPVALLVSYAFLLNCYYLSVGSSLSTIVVRSGHPGWTLLPGIGDIVIESDYDSYDISDHSYNRGELAGFQWQKPHGYQRWADQLLEDMSPAMRAQFLLRLGEPERVKELVREDGRIDIISPDMYLLYPMQVTSTTIQLLSTSLSGEDMRNSTWATWDAFSLCSIAVSESDPYLVTPEIVESMAHVAVESLAEEYSSSEVGSALQFLVRINRGAVTRELLEYLKSTYSDPDLALEIRLGAAWTLSNLAAVDAEAFGLPTGMDQFLLDVTTNPGVLSTQRIQAMETLVLGLAQEEAMDDSGVAQSLADIIVNPKEREPVRMKAVSALAVLVSEDKVYDVEVITPEVLLSVIDGFIRAPSDYELPYINSVLSGDDSLLFGETVGWLAEGNPESATVECGQRLAEFIHQNSGVSASIALDTFGRLVVANPQILDGGAISPQDTSFILYSFLMDESLRAWSPEERIRLLRSCSESVTVEIARSLYAVVRDPSASRQSRLQATAGIFEITTAKPNLIDSRPALDVARRLARELSRPDTEKEELMNALPALARLTQTRSELVTPELVRTVVAAMTSPPFDLSAVDKGLDDSRYNVSGNRNMTWAPLEDLVQAKPEAVGLDSIRICLDALASSHRDVREKGVLACYFLAYNTPESEVAEAISLGAVEVQRSQKPHARVAASRLLELLKIGNLGREVWVHREDLERVRLQVELMSQWSYYDVIRSDRLIGIATTAALEEIDLYEQTVQ